MEWQNGRGSATGMETTRNGTSFGKSSGSSLLSSSNLRMAADFVFLRKKTFTFRDGVHDHMGHSVSYAVEGEHDRERMVAAVS